MTNGEKMKEIFPSMIVGFITESQIGVYFVKNQNSASVFSLDWWNAEYKESTTKNDLGVDSISRQEVLRLLANSIGKTNTYLQTEVLRMSSVTPQESRWIPVSEYLPVTNDEVLVTYIVNGNTKKRYVETAECFDGEWSSVNDEYRIPNTKIEIIAWCEMPKPYREVKE